MTFYIVDSDDTPEIRRNPETNVVEHSMYTWMDPEDCTQTGPT